MTNLVSLRQLRDIIFRLIDKRTLGSGLIVAKTIGTGLLVAFPLVSVIGQTTTTPNVSITGAGASFPSPLYQTWFDMYNKQYPQVQVNYQAVGSDAGIKEFIAHSIDFAASDWGMKPEEITKVKNGVVLLPMTGRMVVVAYNLPNIKTLKLSRSVLADIYLGKIKNWDHAKIAATNQNVKLPQLPITVVYRADRSSINEMFTKHLSAISPEWKARVGFGKTVKWRTGIGGKGNEGITVTIQNTPGAIGYADYDYAQANSVTMARLQNKARAFVQPTLATGTKGLTSIKLSTNLLSFTNDAEGADSYPIVSYSWIIAYKKYDDPQKAEALKKVLHWSLTDGQKFNSALGYVPLPEAVLTKVEAAIKKIN